MNDPSEMHDRAGGSAVPLEPGCPSASATPEPWSHPWHDQLGLRYHRAIAEKIRVHSELRRIAVGNIDRWTARNDYPRSVVAALRHWRELLTTAPVAQLIAAMTDPSEHGHQMRQNTPFAGILTQDERRRIREEYEKATTH